MFKQILKNLELVLEELQVWWGPRGCMQTSKGRWPWLLVLTLHEALWGSLQSDPWAPEKAIPRWARKEGRNLSELLRASARYPVPVQGWHSCLHGKLLECPMPPPFYSLSGASRSPHCLSPDSGPMCPTAGSNSKLSKFPRDLECAYTCLPYKHLMQRKHRSWFNFNNFIDLLKPTGTSKQDIVGWFLRTTAESPGSWIPCHLHLVLQWHSRPFKGRQEGNQVFNVLNTSPTWDLLTHSAAPENVAMFLRNCFILFTL